MRGWISASEFDPIVHDRDSWWAEKEVDKCRAVNTRGSKENYVSLQKDGRILAK